MEPVLKVKCPYCEKEIDNSAEQCIFCGEFFVEPHIDLIKMPSIGQYIVFNILTIGFYSFLWIVLNNKAFRYISMGKDAVKLQTILALIVVSSVTFFINFVLFNVIVKILYLFMSYRILRIIEKYSRRKYGSPITHSECGWFFLDILYVVYFLDTFKERVYHPEIRNHMEPGGWLKYLVIFFVIIFALFCASFIYASIIL